MQKNLKKGFTLIELLVVIAIIGILAAIALTSLGSARNKAKDSAIKSQMASLRASAEVYYDDNGGYGSPTSDCSEEMFADTNIKPLIDKIESDNGDKDVTCQSTGIAWAVETELVSSGTWCVDSNGFSGAGTQTNGVCSGGSGN